MTSAVTIGRSTNGTFLSTAITVVMVLVGFSAFTHFTVTAILGPTAPSKSDDMRIKTTAPIAPARLPEREETIVHKEAIAPAKVSLEKQSDAVQSAEQRLAVQLATHREGKSDNPSRKLASTAITARTTEPDHVAVFHAELQNTEAANDLPTDAQQRPEQREIAAVDLQQNPTEADQPQAELAQSVPAPRPKPTELAKAASALTRSARVRTDVNMRAGPRNSADVITAVRAGREVKVINDCKHWCEVIFDGKRGWIYKRFVR
jgi:hypothetical protein